MSKNNKNDLKTVKASVGRVGNTLMHMVGDRGIKKRTGISRHESAALAFGMGIGIGLGFLAATDPEWRDTFVSSDGETLARGEAVKVAAKLYDTGIHDYVRSRERLLSISRGDSGVALIAIEHEGEVR